MACLTAKHLWAARLTEDLKTTRLDHSAMHLFPGIIVISVTVFLVAFPGIDAGDEDIAGIKFYLVTTKNKDKPEEIHAASVGRVRQWDSGSPVVILIHNWMEQARKDSWRLLSLQPMQEIVKAYLDTHRPENIVLVDWSKYSKSLDYKKVEKGVGMAGARTAEFILRIVSDENVAGGLANVHVIGYGLGADAAGVAGAEVQNLSGGSKIGCITAIDGGRTKKLKMSKFDETRLDQSDADFVQVIHCSIMPYHYEKPKNIQDTAFGHVDFYPEGGIYQKGCKPLIPFFDIKYISAPCSHLACPKLYAKSIKGYKFHGCRCQDAKHFEKDKCDCSGRVLMGEHCTKSARGPFFVETGNLSKMNK